MKVFTKVNKVNETTEHQGQRGIWSHEKGERSEVNIDEDNPEIRVATVDNEESATDNRTSERSQVITQRNENKHDLTIGELDILQERIMPLRRGDEIEWVMMTQDVTKGLTITDKKAMLQIMWKKLENHADALNKVKILLVHAAQRPDQYPNPLDEFYAWMTRQYKCTARQRLIQLNVLLKRMFWSWGSNPADRILAIMHEVHFTWDDVENNEALRDEIKAFIRSNMGVSMNSVLCEKPVKEWYKEITNIWESLKINEPIEENQKAILTGNKNKRHYEINEDEKPADKRCHNCGLTGHIAHNCKTKTNDRKRKTTRQGMTPDKRQKRTNKSKGNHVNKDEI